MNSPNKAIIPEDPERPSKGDAAASSKSSEAASPADTSARLRAMLQQLWISQHATLAERVNTLRTAGAQLAAGTLDEPLRAEAESAAHRLAGILGTFGLPQGTELARQTEILLHQPPTAEDAPRLSGLVEELAVLIASPL